MRRRHRAGDREEGRSQGGIEHLLRGGGQDRLSMHYLDRRRDTRERACRWLEIAKAGQTAQVAPIGAGPVAAIALGQDSAQSRGQCRLQRHGADANPSLEVAGTGLKHDTGLMPCMRMSSSTCGRA